MRLSVIIPTYNRADYVCESIDSVLARITDDTEIVVVDDGSTDSTREVLKPYEDRIRYLRIANGGPAIARNAGMRSSTGEYLSYLDDDDHYYPYKSEIQRAVLDRRPDVGMVYSDFSAFADDEYFDKSHLHEYHSSAYLAGNITYDDLFDEKHRLGDFLDDPDALSAWGIDANSHHVYFGNIYDSYLMNTVVFTNSMMFRKTVYEKVGDQQRKFGMFHDLEFALRLCKAGKVGFIDLPTYKLRYHPDQISTTKRKNGELVAIKIQKDLLRVTKYHCYFDKEYYAQNKARVDHQLARLARATAVPMMAIDCGSAHKDHYYPRRARAYLDFCARLGHPQHLLMAMTYLPSLLRRVCFFALRILRIRWR